MFSKLNKVLLVLKNYYIYDYYYYYYYSSQGPIILRGQCISGQVIRAKK